MMHEFVTYSDGTLVVSSDIRKKKKMEKNILLFALKDQRKMDLTQ